MYLIYFLESNKCDYMTSVNAFFLPSLLVRVDLINDVKSKHFNNSAATKI